MRKIKVIIDTGFAGGIHEDELEVEDNATDEEIEEEVQDVVFNYISYSWKEREGVEIVTKESICLNCIHQFKIGGCTACSHPDNYDSVGNVLKGRRELIAEYIQNGCPLKETK